MSDCLELHKSRLSRPTPCKGPASDKRWTARHHLFKRHTTGAREQARDRVISFTVSLETLEDENQAEAISALRSTSYYQQLDDARDLIISCRALGRSRSASLVFLVSHDMPREDLWLTVLTKVCRNLLFFPIEV